MEVGMADGEKTIKINGGGGPVSVEVYFGKAHLGDYRVRLVSRDQDDNKIVHFTREGDNDDGISDKFRLPVSASDLNEKVLSWRLIINNPDDLPGQKIYAKVIVSQDGNILKDSPFEYNDPIQNGSYKVGAAPFVVS